MNKVDLVVVEWNPMYSQAVQTVKGGIETAFTGYLATIDDSGDSTFHIGSTAVEGMCGKPIVDFAVVVQGLLPNIPDDIIEKMNKLGFI